MKAIETFYNGYRFRSRIEVRREERDSDMENKCNG